MYASFIDQIFLRNPSLSYSSNIPEKEYDLIPNRENVSVWIYIIHSLRCWTLFLDVLVEKHILCSLCSDRIKATLCILNHVRRNFKSVINVSNLIYECFIVLDCQILEWCKWSINKISKRRLTNQNAMIVEILNLWQMHQT